MFQFIGKIIDRLIPVVILLAVLFAVSQTQCAQNIIQGVSTAKTATQQVAETGQQTLESVGVPASQQQITDLLNIVQNVGAVPEDAIVKGVETKKILGVDITITSYENYNFFKYSAFGQDFVSSLNINDIGSLTQNGINDITNITDKLAQSNGVVPNVSPILPSK